MDSYINVVMTAVISSMVGGLFTGFVCFIAMRQDMKWLKESVAELRTLFFKYVQQNSTHCKG